MRREAALLGLALVFTTVAQAADLYKPYRFCVASSAARKELYYSAVFKLASDESLNNAWRQHLLLYHSGADVGSMDCSQASETKVSASVARDAAVSHLRRGETNLRAIDTDWTPGH